MSEQHQVTELAPGDVQRGGEGASAGGTQPQQGYREDGSAQGQPAEMSADQQAGIQKLAQMRERYKDPSLTHEQRERLTQAMSELSQHVFNKAPRPSWYGPQTPDPKFTDTRPADSLRASFEAANAPADKQTLSFAVQQATAQGVSRPLAQGLANFCEKLGLSGGVLKDVLDRARSHYAADHHYDAETHMRVLNKAELKEFVAIATEFSGSAERYQALTDRARAFLEFKRVLDKADKTGLTRTSLFLDPRFLAALSRAADALGVPKRKR